MLASTCDALVYDQNRISLLHQGCVARLGFEIYAFDWQWGCFILGYGDRQSAGKFPTRCGMIKYLSANITELPGGRLLVDSSFDTIYQPF